MVRDENRREWKRESYHILLLTRLCIPLCRGLRANVRPYTLEYLDSVRKAQAESTVTWDWRKGDLVLLDNFALCHGRTKYDPDRMPKRRVLASMLF